MNKYANHSGIRLRINLTLFLLLFSSIQLQAQDKKKLLPGFFKPFSVLILSPEGATIDDSLKVYIDSIEFEFRDVYFNAVEEIELKLKSERKRNKRKKSEAILNQARSYETEAFDFKYYKMISIGTYVTLQEIFNAVSWAEKSMTCEIMEKWLLHTDDLTEVANYMEVDYIIYYQNIHTEKKGDDLVLKMTTLIFSKADSTIIVEKETEGNIKNMDCELLGENPLMCLLSSVVESSAQEIIAVLSERQMK